MGNKKNFFRFLKRKKKNGGRGKEQEATQVAKYPFTCGGGKQMAHPYKGRLLSSEKEWTAGTASAPR